MIKSIRIKNFALIESAEIEFFGGFNALSGETGAGKTVVINAINFSLGAKADKSLIRNGESFCQTEICFVDENDTVKSILDEFDIEYDGEIIIRRKLTVEGRSDIKINGVTVTLSMLKSLTLYLCDVYGQSEHYSLLSKARQLSVLDSFIGKPIEDIKNEVYPLIQEIKNARKILDDNGGDERSRAIRMDVLSYQINEIEKANLVDGEEEDLLEKKKLFQNAEKIGESLSIVNQAISSDNGILDMLSTAIYKVQNISNFSNEYSELYDRLYSLKAEAEDVSYVAENLLSKVSFNEYEKAEVFERLDLLNSLKRKYGNSYNEIMEFYSKCSEEYENLQDFERVSKECETTISNALKTLDELYQKAYQLRVKYAEELSQKVENELSTLGMKSARFEVCIQRQNRDISLDCDSEVEFLFSANKGEPLKNMSKVISGGEMSRFMLALKIVSADVGGTYIFDEIDAGISGDVARIVAKKFVELSKKAQIITISHLPQILSYADNNYLICKNEKDNKTVSNVKLLDLDGKINEIIRLTGGGDLELAKLNAISAINSANEYKKSI